MSDALKLGFGALNAPAKGVLVVFCDDKLKFGAATNKALGETGSKLARAAKVAAFTGKKSSLLELIAPEGLKVDRLVVIGTGKPGDLGPQDFLKFGGLAMSKVPARESDATVFAELPGGAMTPEQAAAVAQGVRLRAYAFDRYKTKRKEEDTPAARRSVTIAVGDAAAARRAYEPLDGITDGVVLARDLVNEPANVLYPIEFARRAGALKNVGVKLEVLGEPALKKIGMNALLGVGQGSDHDSRVVVMRWDGGKKGDAPVAFIGKGVCFDTGGISIKPAGSMEDMKGDMAGAACVTGLMHALAARKAKVNAVGVIGLVENMPGGKAQRPGDVVKSLSGQTIEIINTDAEGRLVLADAIWYTAQRFKPKFMIDLATLTGAIIVALGHDYAGMFCNDDKLAEQLTKAGSETGEGVWRMPLGDTYDKMIDSRFADVKNTGGSRWASAITAAQFIKRFVDDNIPWAHLDIAGTGFDSPKNEINQSWGAGWGVRLLDRLVADYYEK
ncbi:MAG TPA: leucyl aminopeptidase [Pseudolabrys sp.]|nr:leucyl aminopeptidase [Pseudolabrys sp.]